MAVQTKLTKRQVLARVGAMAVAAPLLSTVASAQRYGDTFDCNEFSFSRRNGEVTYDCNDSYSRRGYRSRRRRFGRVGRRRIDSIRVTGDDFEIDLDRRGEITLMGDGDVDIDVTDVRMDILVDNARVEIDEFGIRYVSDSVLFEHEDEFRFSLMEGAGGVWSFSDDDRDRIEFSYDDGGCRLDYDTYRGDVDLRISGC
jgi:hypothetical protein